jgi:hypothetical protein
MGIFPARGSTCWKSDFWKIGSRAGKWMGHSKLKRRFWPYDLAMDRPGFFFLIGLTSRYAVGVLGRSLGWSHALGPGVPWGAALGFPLGEHWQGVGPLDVSPPPRKSHACETKQEKDSYQDFGLSNPPTARPLAPPPSPLDT